MRLWVIDGSNEITNGCGLDASFDNFPRRHKVGKGDNTEVVTERCTQQRGSLLESRDAWQCFHFNVRLSVTLHLIYQRSHAIDTCIARGNHDNSLVLLSKQKGLLSTFTFLLHACVDALASRLDIRFYELEIILISHNNICLPYCFEYSGGDVFLAARTDACDDDFSHIAHKDRKILAKFQILLLKRQLQTHDQHATWRVECIFACRGVDASINFIEEVVYADAGFQICPPQHV